MNTNVQFTPSGKSHLGSRAPAWPGPCRSSRLGGLFQGCRNRRQERTPMGAQGSNRTQASPARRHLGRGDCVSRRGQRTQDFQPSTHQPPEQRELTEHPGSRHPYLPASCLTLLGGRKEGCPGEARAPRTQTGATSTLLRELYLKETAF